MKVGHAITIGFDNRHQQKNKKDLAFWCVETIGVTRYLHIACNKNVLLNNIFIHILLNQF